MLRALGQAPIIARACDGRTEMGRGLATRKTKTVQLSLNFTLLRVSGHELHAEANDIVAYNQNESESPALLSMLGGRQRA